MLLFRKKKTIGDGCWEWSGMGTSWWQTAQSFLQWKKMRIEKWWKSYVMGLMSHRRMGDIHWLVAVFLSSPFLCIVFNFNHSLFKIIAQEGDVSKLQLKTHTDVCTVVVGILWFYCFLFFSLFMLFMLWLLNCGCPFNAVVAVSGFVRQAIRERTREGANNDLLDETYGRGHKLMMNKWLHTVA